MKKHILVAALAAIAGQAFATDYYLVVPVPNRVATTGNITVSLNTTNLPAGRVGRPYAGYDFNALLQVKGDPNYTPGGVAWSVVSGALPSGLTLSANGTLTGTPASAGTARFQVKASYKTKAGEQTYRVLIGDITIALADAQLPAGVEGAPYTYDFRPHLAVSGDPEFDMAGVVWSHTGALPPGLSLNSAGVLAGVLAAPGTYPVTITASHLNKTGQRTYQVAVGAITVALASASLPNATIDAGYSEDLRAKLSITGDTAYAGGGAGVTWSIAGGSLPAGVSLASGTGTLAGTPTAVGTSSFTARATYKGKVAQQDYAIQVKPRGLALQAAGYRTWDDGTVAASCKAYRAGYGKYAYTGATGSGAYRVQPPGMSALNVHCDMTTDGGGWTLAAWSRGNAGMSNMPVDFFVRQVNPANIADRSAVNASSSINVEAASKALGTNDVMLVAPTYSDTPILEKGRGVWSYDAPDCDGVLGHTARDGGCSNHGGNDNHDTADKFNIAIYAGSTAIVPGWLNMGEELCWSGRGWCDFEFYIR